jgi:hypothetical protein
MRMGNHGGQGETEILGEKPVTVTMIRARTRASAMRCRRLTAWTMARPCSFVTFNFYNKYLSAINEHQL